MNKQDTRKSAAGGDEEEYGSPETFKELKRLFRQWSVRPTLRPEPPQEPGWSAYIDLATGEKRHAWCL
jgi:hypothetical protein